MGFKNISTDRIIGLSAMLISLLTLIIFIYQTNIIRNQSRLSVTPRLSFTSSVNGADSIIYFTEAIENKGLGPAIIEEISIIKEGKKYKMDAQDYYAKLYPKVAEYGEFIQNIQIGKGTTLSPGEAISLYTYTLHPSKLEELLQYLGVGSDENPLEIEVKYASIYEELWTLRNKSKGHPQKLN